MKKGAYLHAHYEKPTTKKRLLNKLAEKDVKIATMRLDKREVMVAGDPNQLYSNMVVSLINRLYADGVVDKSDDIEFIASRRNTSVRLNDDFNDRIEYGTREVVFRPSIMPASVDKCLQAVDFVSWAMWQKYVVGDDTYSDLLSEKIVNEYVMFEKSK